jgi:hypothetical protein
MVEVMTRTMRPESQGVKRLLSFLEPIKVNLRYGESYSPAEIPREQRCSRSEWRRIKRRRGSATFIDHAHTKDAHRSSDWTGASFWRVGRNEGGERVPLLDGVQGRKECNMRFAVRLFVSAILFLRLPDVTRKMYICSHERSIARRR